MAAATAAATDSMRRHAALKGTTDSRKGDLPMLPATTKRVSSQTSSRVNAEIQSRTARSVARHAHSGPAAIERRLEQLNREWDIERMLEANAATAALIGLTLGATIDRRWFIFPAVVAGFLLQHALQGWCPPLPLFRRLGVRTQSGIEEERTALKALRGDFRGVTNTGDASKAISAARSS